MLEKKKEWVMDLSVTLTTPLLIIKNRQILTSPFEFINFDITKIQYIPEKSKENRNYFNNYLKIFRFMIDNEHNTNKKKLKEFFKKKNLTQSSIARILKMKQPLVCGYLNNKPFGKDMARKWEEAFGLSSAWLLTGSGEMEIRDIMKKSPSNSKVIEFPNTVMNQLPAARTQASNNGEEIEYNREVGERLILLYNKLIRKEQVKNQKDFCKKFGISTSFFTEVKKGRSGVTSDALNNISKDFMKYRDWLISGENTPFEDHAPNEREIKSAQETKTFPLIPIEAVAGYGTEDNVAIAYEDCEQYQIPDFENRGVDFLIRVSGSSMYPKYSNGDVLACKKINDILFFQWGKVYVIDSSQGALVKRVFEDKDNPDNIICVSDNGEHYPPFSMPKSDVRSLSIVIGVVRLE